MEQGPGGAAAGGAGLLLPLSDTEQQRYSELFSLCCSPAPEGGSAPAPAAGGSKVGDLFRASQLPADTLHQITELCGAKRVGYFGPAQFYVALKLIAAAQSGLPVRIESIKSVSYEARHSTHQQDGPATGNYGSKSALVHSSLSRFLSVESEPQDSSNYPDDPWRITEEQREYYINQFKSLQPDLNSLISGSVAKNFFTKSKLPIPELSHVWTCEYHVHRELSDVDCDGALTLPEFCAAFHLIVARKNGYPLPDMLPETLLPDYLQPASLKPKRDCALLDSYSESLSVSQQTRDFNRTELETVCEDPTNSEPLILFDVATSIVEPTSVEEMPDKSALTQDANSDDNQALNISTTTKTIPKDFKPSQHLSVKTVVQESNTLKARPRSRSYSSTSIEEAMKKGEEPPMPPPRPQKSHSRASSLDLNKIFQQNTQAVKSGWLPPPPALPPRPFVSQQGPHHVTNTESVAQAKSSYVEFRLKEQTEQVSEIELHPQMNRAPSQTEESSPMRKEILLTQPPSKPIRRKFRSENQMLENQELTPTSSVTSSLPAVKPHLPAQNRQSSKQKRAIQTAIRKNKEANAVLARLNSELQQQLKEVHKERIALETQLEQLRPVTVL
ncbi:ralBP1-associated Eps domain-containing protein 2 isoform X10 [Gopherus evgoodei]|uniref:ralBP1-associated Eps domain-containing protein 2 isoform X10 n=1 Tax=Gopherus evgoodei TaxID=1825980 RepID=UPI0011D02A64|nr:ralBP1-associated Eps domain-containing protein 2 isoform X10 [Gopherus evgoodei]